MVMYVYLEFSIFKILLTFKVQKNIHSLNPANSFPQLINNNLIFYNTTLESEQQIQSKWRDKPIQACSLKPQAQKPVAILHTFQMKKNRKQLHKLSYKWVVGLFSTEIMREREGKKCSKEIESEVFECIILQCRCYSPFNQKIFESRTKLRFLPLDKSFSIQLKNFTFIKLKKWRFSFRFSYLTFFVGESWNRDENDNCLRFLKAWWCFSDKSIN